MDEPKDTPPRLLEYSPAPLSLIPLYRRVLVVFLLMAGVLALIAGLCISGDGAKADMLVVGFGLVLFAVVIRSQPIRR